MKAHIKVPRFNFYSAIITALVAIMIAAGIALMQSCQLVPAIAPDDWAYNPPIPEPIDTTVIDSLPIDSIVIDTPCTDPQEITDPPFVTMYHEITELVQTDRVIIIGGQSAVITAADIDQLGPVIDSLLELWKPQYEYTVYVRDDHLAVAVIVDGTNDREQFYLGAQIRYNGLKHFAGWATQAYTFAGALTAAEYDQVIIDYPSVYVANWRGTHYDSTKYIDQAYAILGECKEGRWYINFTFNPYEILDTIPVLFEAAGWETVFHGPDPYETLDLRHTWPLSDSLMHALNTRQIIIKS